MDFNLIPTGYTLIHPETGKVFGHIDDQGDYVYRGYVLNKLGRRIRIGDFSCKAEAAREVYARYLGINALNS